MSTPKARATESQRLDNLVLSQYASAEKRAVVQQKQTAADLADTKESERAIRRELLEMERSFERAEGARKLLEEQLRAKTDEAHSRQLQDGTKIDQAKARLKFVWKQNGDQKEEILKLQKQLAEQKAELMSSKGAQVARSASQSSQLGDRESASKISALEHDRDMLKEQLAQAKRDANELEEQLQATQERAAALRGETGSVEEARAEAQASSMRVRVLETQIEQLKESGAGSAAADLREEARAHRELQRRHRAALEELQEFRSNEERAGVLREQIRTLQTKAARAQQQLEEAAKLQARFADATQKLEDWREAMQGLFPEDPTPAGVAKGVGALRSEQLSTLTRMGQVQAEASLAERQLDELRSKSGDAKSVCDDLTLRAEKAETALAKAERRLQFAVKERDGLKLILESINEDDTLQNHDTQRIKRIAELEASVKQAQDEVGELRAENAKVDELSSENRKLSKLLEKTEAECALMQSKLGRGEYNVRDTKVLHFRFNPEAEAMKQKKLDKEGADTRQLRADNEKLKARVAELELNTSSRAGGGLSVDLAELTELKAQLAKSTSEARQLQEKAKHAERLKSMFTLKATEFREACFLLTGYKIEMKPGEYKLRSMYSDSENDVLMFRKTDDGLQLLDTDFARKLDDDVVAVLKRFGSIPAFTATITTELFQKVTRVRGTGH